MVTTELLLTAATEASLLTKYGRPIGHNSAHIKLCLLFRLRPYHAEYTGSRPITEVMQRRA